jgi:hypothetical protein
MAVLGLFLPGFLPLFSLPPTFVLELDLFGTFLAFNLPPTEAVE